ncbi:DNA-binding protein [Ekhidna sp.]|uniref:DNA-binding protein n=1 Tax=Ekhidna sp. TaxID=2608089 RepID=UPI003B5A376C
MNFIRQIERLQKLNKLIEQERTGPPDKLADSLGVSRSKLYELLDGLRGMGKKVEYKRTIKSFHYTDETKLDIKFSLKVVRKNDLEKISGGLHFFPSVLFSGRKKFSFTPIR